MGSENFLKLSVSFLEEALQKSQPGIKTKFSRRILTKIVSLYLEQLSSVEEIESTHFFRIFDVKGHIDSYPEDFYFLNPNHTYVRNLVLFNTALVIDDLVVRCLSQLHSSKTELGESVKRTALGSLFYILKYRTFRRPTLRLIFDNLVYFDADDNFYRFGILDFIIRQYKESDASIALGSLPSHAGCSTALASSSESQLPHLQKGGVYCDKGDLCNDNTMVLSNLIWEEMRRYLLDSEVTPCDPDRAGIEEHSESLFINRGVLMEEFSHSDIEKMCIMELLSTIIDSTGSFFCNRIVQNQELFERIKGLPGIVKLLDKMVANFERVDLLSGTFLRILEKKNTSRSLKLASILKHA